MQKKFRFALPRIKGFEFRDEPLNGCHIIVGKEAGTNPDKAVVYFPGGGSRRWQLPYKSSIKNYIRETGAELWISMNIFVDRTATEKYKISNNCFREPEGCD